MKSVAIVLSAGKGTRMKSKMPKVLHKVCGRPMLAQVLNQVEAAGIEKSYIVIGHGAEAVKEVMGDKYAYAVQEPQLGTGHCVQQAIPVIEAADAALIVCGDTPLLQAETFKQLQEKYVAMKAENPNFAGLVLTAVVENPKGYGRIIRDEQGSVIAIIEEKDATVAERAIKEINTGTYFFDYEILKDALSKIDNNNVQNEYYLTDIVKICAAENHFVDTLVIENPADTLGVNDRIQLSEANAILRWRKNLQLMTDGVTLVAPMSTYVDLDVQVGADTIIYPNVHLRGNTVIGEDCVIDSDCIIENTIIGDNCKINKTIMDEAVVGSGANVGPFAYLRPKTVLADNVKIGDFAEVKNAYIGEGSKIPHLSYVGDAQVGSKVNIGCGTITCNYDGVNKFQTVIGDDVFIGSNTNLVAPVEVEEGAYVAAGSTITAKVPAGALAVARGKQRNLEGWATTNSPKLKPKLKRDF